MSGGCQFGCPPNSIGLHELRWRNADRDLFAYAIMPGSDAFTLYNGATDSVVVLDESTGAVTRRGVLTPEDRAAMERIWRTERDTFHAKVARQSIVAIRTTEEFEYDSLALVVQIPMWRGESWDYYLSFRERSTGRLHYVVIDRCQISTPEIEPHGRHYLKLRYPLGRSVARELRESGTIPPREGPNDADPYELALLDLREVVRLHGE